MTDTMLALSQLRQSSPADAEFLSACLRLRALIEAGHKVSFAKVSGGYTSRIDMIVDDGECLGPYREHTCPTLTEAMEAVIEPHPRGIAMADGSTDEPSTDPDDGTGPVAEPGTSCGGDGEQVRGKTIGCQNDRQPIP